MIASLSVAWLTSAVCCEETTTVFARTGRAVLVLDRHLALAVGQQEGQLSRATRLRELLADAVRGVDGEGHVLLRLVAREAEHHALVAGALLLEQALALGDALGDVGRLALDGRDDGAAVAVEAALRRRVADVADHRLGDLAELDLRLARDLAGDDDQAGLDQRLAGDATLRVLRQQGVEDGVGDLIADLVGMSLVHRLGRENVVLEHSDRLL